MTIIPAIDVLGGQCVRLYKGDYNEVAVYEKDPAAAARSFVNAGAKRIHLVDLDAAQGNWGANRKIIRKIRKSVSCELEIGGGIRKEEDVQELIDLGIDYLILGTIFTRQPGKVEGWISHYGSIFIAAIDALDGKVKINGWETDSGIIDTVLAARAREIGVSEIIYTNISRDGTLKGPDVERTIGIGKASGLPVILSGGVSSEADIEEVSASSNGSITGIIIGKAIYENKLDLPSVFAKYQNGLGKGV